MSQTVARSSADTHACFDLIQKDRETNKGWVHTMNIWCPFMKQHKQMITLWFQHTYEDDKRERKQQQEKSINQQSTTSTSNWHPAMPDKESTIHLRMRRIQFIRLQKPNQIKSTDWKKQSPIVGHHGISKGERRKTFLSSFQSSKIDPTYIKNKWIHCSKRPHIYLWQPQTSTCNQQWRVRFVEIIEPDRKKAKAWFILTIWRVIKTTIKQTSAIYNQKWTSSSEKGLPNSQAATFFVLTIWMLVFAIKVCRQTLSSNFAADVCCQNLPWRFATGVCRWSVPLEFDGRV